MIKRETHAGAAQIISGLMMAIAVSCAVVTTGLFVRREFFTSPVRDVSPHSEKNWEQYVTDGRIIGDPHAPVKIVLFSDFQCPFCRRFAQTTWPAIRDKFGAQVALVYRYWPLAIHPYAYDAARAAECAAAQGFFQSFHDRLFAEQAMIGQKPFMEFAQEAGVPNLEAFTACSEDSASVARIESGISAAAELKLVGTPAILINGTVYPIAPPVEQIIDEIQKTQTASAAAMTGR